MKYQALYREWRPQTLADLVGQDHIRRILSNALSAGRVSHAYLFCGPRGTGKTSTAKILAKALNCVQGPAAEPCNECTACLRITAGDFLDVLEMDAASNNGVDSVRELREETVYTPAYVKKRVYIIDEVHMLTTEAFNALLRTLEEPPAHVIFIFATTEAHKLPLTILSRCQRLDFRRGSVADLMQRLKVVAAGEEVEADDDALLLVARAADGSWRDALSILEQIVAFGARRLTAADVRTILGTVSADRVVECLEALAAEDAARALQVVAALAEEGKDIRDFLRSLVAHLRNVLLVGAAGGAVMPDGATAEEARLLSEQAQRFPPAFCLRAIEALSDAEREMRRDSQHRLLLEISLLRIISGAKLAPPRPAAAEVAAEAPAPPERPAPRPRPRAAEETAPPPAGSLDSGGDAAARPAPRPAPAPPADTAPPPAATGDGAPPTLDDVLTRWPLIVERAGSARLRGILREVRPAKVSGREVLLLVRQGYTFHRDQLEKPENLRAVADAALHALGTRVTIRIAMEDEGGGGGADNDTPPPQAAPLADAAPAQGVEEPDPYDADTMSVKDVLDLFHGRLIQNKDDR